MCPMTERGYKMSHFAEPKDDPKKGRPLESIRIEPGKNGFSVHVRRREPPRKTDKKGSLVEPYDYREPKPMFYSTAEEVAACVKRECTGEVG